MTFIRQSIYLVGAKFYVHDDFGNLVEIPLWDKATKRIPDQMLTLGWYLVETIDPYPECWDLGYGYRK